MNDVSTQIPIGSGGSLRIVPTRTYRLGGWFGGRLNINFVAFLAPSSGRWARASPASRSTARSCCPRWVLAAHDRARGRIDGEELHDRVQGAREVADALLVGTIQRLPPRRRSPRARSARRTRLRRPRSSGGRAGGLRGGARLDGQDGRGRAANDALGDAADHETVETGAAVGADHDEVGVLLAGGVGDLDRRRPGPEDAPRGQALGGGGGHALAESLLDPLALLLPDFLEGGAGELGVGVQGHLAEDVDERQLASVDARELASDFPGGLRGIGEVGRAQDSLEHVGIPPSTVGAWAVPVSRS